MDHFIEYYFYKARLFLIIPFFYLFREWIIDKPMHQIVHSGVFIFTVVFLAIYCTLFIYMYLRTYWSMLLMVIPLPFILLSQVRYNGNINTSYDYLFYIFFTLFVIEIIIWFISLFFKQRSLSYNIFDKNIKAIILDSKQLPIKTITIKCEQDCIFIDELIGCTGSFDFREQYLVYLQLKKPSIEKYHITCSYFKFGDYHQVKGFYFVSLG